MMCQFIFSVLVIIWGAVYVLHRDNWIAEYGIIPTCYVLIAYPHAFQVLLTKDNICQVEGFNTIAESIYTSFKIMLNMVNFNDY